MTSRTRASLWAAAAIAVVCAFPCTVRGAQFLSPEIASALAARGAFLQGVELPEKDFFTLKSSYASSDKQSALRTRLNTTSHGGPWRHYVRGVLDDIGGDSRGAQLFSKAIEEAATDPGALWLLLVEFIRSGRTQPADECLETLRGWIFASGGRSAPLLAQQLILLGNTIIETNPNGAEYCYNASVRFDENQCWWLYRKGAIGFPNNAIASMPGFIAGAIETAIKSWRAQVSLLCGLHRFFSAAIFIFVCAVFFTFAVKYLPHGVHPIGDTLFAPAAPSVRTFSGVAVAVSTLLLGVVPALWATAFLVCRFLSASEKRLLFFSCVILTIAPLNFYVSGFLARTIAPNSPAVLLDRSIREGYSQDLYVAAARNIAAEPNNYANHLARAISAIKSGDLNISSGAMAKALEAAPNDPVALMYAGALSFLTSDADGMERHYGNVLKNYPQHTAEATYSLSQAYAGNGDFTTSDMISEAASLNTPLISSHMRTNDNYFGDAPPPLRRVIQPILSPAYFWSRLFIADPAEILRLKGKTYYGLSPISAFCASAAVMLVFTTFYFTVWGKASKVKTYFTCRICGRLLCRRCRKGTTCSACYKKNLDSSNNAATMYNLQKRCQDRALIRGDMVKYALGVIVPGSERLYNGESAFKAAAAMFVTSMIFAAFYCALTFRTYYPSRAAIAPIYFVSVLALYNITAFVRQSSVFAKIMKVRAKMSIKAN